MTRIAIVRHGNTFSPGDTVLRTGARTDLPLSPSGLAQAQALGPALARHLSGHRVGFVYSGPLQRTLATADALRGHFTGPALPVVAEFLREIDHGPDEGQPEEAVFARLGHEALTLWETHSVMPAEWSPRPEAFITLWQRFLAALARPEPEFAPEFAPGGEPDAAVIVTSNGLARFALQALAFDTPTPPGKLRTGAFGIIDTDDGRTARLITWDERP